MVLGGSGVLGWVWGVWDIEGVSCGSGLNFGENWEGSESIWEGLGGSGVDLEVPGGKGVPAPPKPPLSPQRVPAMAVQDPRPKHSIDSNNPNEKIKVGEGG